MRGRVPNVALRLGLLVPLLWAGCECSPPSCRSTSEGGLACGAGQVAVCQERVCAVVAAVGTSCDPDPCGLVEPRVCANGLACDPNTLTCDPAPGPLSACDPSMGGDGCTWPYICSGIQSSTYPSCPDRPPNVPTSADGFCRLGAVVGAVCDASWNEPGVACRRCEPGLDCVAGVCVQTCNTGLDCPCPQTCRDGLCTEAACVVGAACERDGVCGECLDGVDGPACQLVGGRRDGEGRCVVDRSEPVCDAPACPPGQISVCGGRRCASVAVDPNGPDDACTPNPCTAEAPRVCAYPASCTYDDMACQTDGCAAHCNVAPTVVPDGRFECVARSFQNARGMLCPFPLVCRGFAGEWSGTSGGCPPRGEVPGGPDTGYVSVCVRGQLRGETCDASYDDRRPSCRRCEPGLECVDERCQQPCLSASDCACGEACNGGYCGDQCDVTATACAAVSGQCGTCVSNPLGPATCDPGDDESEAPACSGATGVDDDCDALIDEPVLDRRCDGIDDDCDGAVDENWSFVDELIPIGVGVTCGGMLAEVAPHLECTHGALSAVATPGLDYCDGPGWQPSPTGTGFLWCGGGLGESCLTLPCHPAFTCGIAGVCEGEVPSASYPCTFLCDPANSRECDICFRRRFGNECDWPGIGP
jgi:hypothetical protein